VKPIYYHELRMREKIAPNLEGFFKIVSELGKKENEQGEL